MEQRDLKLAAVVLAAGAGSRFSAEPGAKLLADDDGESVLGRVLAAVEQYAPTVTVVVLGHAADRIEAAIEWRGQLRVRNHAAERGLASSIQVGIDALRALPAEFDGAFIVLGDQPRLRPEVMSALERSAASARPADRSAIVPRYELDPGPRNPVLLLRPAWSWVDDLEGDVGLAALIDERPDMVQLVPVPGAMPDIDRPDDVE